MLKVKTFCVEIQRSIYAKQPNIVVLEQKKQTVYLTFLLIVLIILKRTSSTLQYNN